MPARQLQDADVVKVTEKRPCSGVQQMHPLQGFQDKDRACTDPSQFLQTFSILCIMKLMRLFLFLLAFSLVLQNTCPYGFAAKTAFAAPQAHDCPFKKSHHAPQKDRDSVDDNPVKPLYPAFVFSIPDTQVAALCYQMKPEYAALSSDNYKDPFKEPLIKPPVA